MSSLGTSRWGWVRGLCHRDRRLGTLGGGGEWGYDRGTMSPTTPTLLDAYTPCIKTPLAESHLFFIPSLFASQTIDGLAGFGLDHSGSHIIKPLLLLYFMTSTKNKHIFKKNF